MGFLRNSYSEGVGQRNIWITLSLLTAAVLAPTVCVLWLVQKAARNERLAVISLLEETRANQVALGIERIQNLVRDLTDSSRFLTLDTSPSISFFKLVEAEFAESVIVRDRDRNLLYPNFVSSTQNLDSINETAAASETLSEVRALIQAGEVAESLRRINAILDDERQYGAYILPNGRHAIPMMAMMAVELTATGENGLARQVDALGRIVKNYSIRIPSSQRRFFLRKYLSYQEDSLAGKLLHAETIAVQWLDGNRENTTNRPEERFNLLPVDSSQKLDLLISDEAFQAGVNDHLSVGMSTDEGKTRLIVLRNDAAVEKGVELLARDMEDVLIGWKVSLVADSASFPEDVDSHVILYVWVGLLVIAISISLMIVVIALIRKQSSVAQLKNDLVATVSHELKTPVASIRLLVDTLLDEKKDDPNRTKDYLELISKENKRLGGLIENFLSFSRMERNKNSFMLQPSSVNDLVSETVATFQDRFANQELDLSVDVEEGIGPVKADAEALQTALGNLLENAYKYSGDEKRISLRARNGNGSVSFEVKDNGIGIAKKDQKKVFNRFYQGNRKLSGHVGGVGLGLSIVSFIVSKHKGQVELESEEGQGSLFRLIIPNA